MIINNLKTNMQTLILGIIKRFNHTDTVFWIIFNFENFCVFFS